MAQNCSGAVNQLTPAVKYRFIKAIPYGRYRCGVRYPQRFLLLVAVLGLTDGRVRPPNHEVGVTWTPKTEPVLMRASLPARIGQEKPHESQTPQPRADHPQAAHC